MYKEEQCILGDDPSFYCTPLHASPASRLFSYISIRRWFRAVKLFRRPRQFHSDLHFMLITMHKICFVMQILIAWVSPLDKTASMSAWLTAHRYIILNGRPLSREAFETMFSLLCECVVEKNIWEQISTPPIVGVWGDCTKEKAGCLFLNVKFGSSSYVGVDECDHVVQKVSCYPLCGFGSPTCVLLTKAF